MDGWSAARPSSAGGNRAARQALLASPYVGERLYPPEPARWLLSDLLLLAPGQERSIPPPPRSLLLFSSHTLEKEFIAGKRAAGQGGFREREGPETCSSCCSCSRQHVRCFVLSAGIHRAERALSLWKYYSCRRCKFGLCRVFLLFGCNQDL